MQPDQEKKETCKWTALKYFSFWDASCGRKWVFCEPGPDVRGFRFCPYCGKPLEEVK